MEVPKKPKPFSVLDKVLDWINVFSLLSVAVLMFVQVILRYVLKMPLMGIEELCYFPTVWLYLFASSAILLWLTWWGYDYLKYALRLQKETASLYLPWIYAEAAVFVSMFLMTLYTLLELRDMITLYRTTPASLPVEKEGD